MAPRRGAIWQAAAIRHIVIAILLAILALGGVVAAWGGETTRFGGPAGWWVLFALLIVLPTLGIVALLARTGGGEGSEDSG